MLKKQSLKGKSIVKVTFYTSDSIQADTVHIAGDFNNWDETSHAMEKLKDGRFKTTLELETGREYQFRYLIDSTRWENDWEADKYVSNPFSGENSVVTT